MGNARYSDYTYRSFTDSVIDIPREEIFRQSQMHPDLDPKRIQVREAVDSVANPNTTPVIIGVDVTGSMGVLAEQIVRGNLGDIMRDLYAHDPVTDPQIMCAAIGDGSCDQAPLQVTQFEADSQPMVEQIQKIWLESRGGSNAGESYPLIWAFAKHKVIADAIRVRRRKGYIFTIGDECPLLIVDRSQMNRILDVRTEEDVDVRTLLAEVSANWNVFHLIVKPVPHQPVVSMWREVLGQHAIEISNRNQLATSVVSIIRITEGATTESVADSVDDETAPIVRRFGRGLRPAATTDPHSNAVPRLR